MSSSPAYVMRVKPKSLLDMTLKTDPRSRVGAGVAKSSTVMTLSAKHNSKFVVFYLQQVTYHYKGIFFEGAKTKGKSRNKGVPQA